MTDEEQRIAEINKAAAGHLEDWLHQIEEEEVTPDDLLAATYGSLIAAALLGFSIESLVQDAQQGAEKLMSQMDSFLDSFPEDSE